MRVVRLATKVVLLAAITGAFAAFNQPASAHPPAIVSEAQRKLISEEVAAFRKEVAAAVAAKDAKRLRLIFAPTFGHTSATGEVEDKSSYISTLLKGEPNIETATATDVVIRIPNDWVGIATGAARLRGENGKIYDVRWTAVYVREGQKWNVAASHVTQLRESKP
jgi:hypothetical protein